MFSELCAEAEVTHKRSEIMSMYRAKRVIMWVFRLLIFYIGEEKSAGGCSSA